MDNFIVSARKYRPSTFMSVVGQQSITTTLKNSIKNQQLAHAYLFCGPRGVGKTTCARIYAKTINCQNITDDFESCNECESCKAFNESRSYNIHELDAASNNSVEDIRTLIEQVRIPPQLGKYSLYIIDEVHMLSAAAFNAFLKTLEEPPGHAIFILATTEKHKILPTILSRCQIFDFNRIKVEDAANHLAYVARCENIEAEPEALTVIAQKADGAMRDALSLFDQIASFSERKITYQNAIENLNILDYDYYFRLVNTFLKSELSEALLIFNEILNNGFDGHHFVSGLSSHLRDLMVCTDEATIELLEVGASIKEKYKLQAKECSRDFLFKSLGFANNCDLNYKTSNNQRLLVELMLMQICNIIPEETKRKEELEERKKLIIQAQTQVVNQTANTNTSVSVKDKADTAPKTRKTPSSSFSISRIVNNTSSEKKEEQTETTKEENENILEKVTEKDSYTIEQIITYWNEYSNSLSSRFNSMLKAHTPTLNEDEKIEFMVNSQTSDDTFNKEVKQKLTLYLRSKLKNGDIEIITVLNKSNVIKRPLTQSDKYNFLIQKNPALEKLKVAMKLDFK